MTERALVVGFGSIGRRHANLLRQLGLSCAVVSRRAAHWPDRYGELSEALADWKPAYVVVANETAAHRRTMEALADADFRGAVMVEKPLFERPGRLPDHRFRRLHVGFNLRFHPAIRALRSAVAGEQLYSVQVRVGQWLPDWRPDRDYRVVYSAKSAHGGGVLRDLSHELDILLWVFGAPERLVALGGKRSHLEIDSDDLWSVLLDFPFGAVGTLHLDYLARPGYRSITVLGSFGTLSVDLIAGTTSLNGESRDHSIDRDETYFEMHRAMLEDGRELCTVEEASAVDAIADRIRQSADEGRWVHL